MPELVNSRVGSLPGTRGADGTMVWPFPLKNSRKSLRIWEVLNLAGAFMRLAVGRAAMAIAFLPKWGGTTWRYNLNHQD